jgi:hypothetical protein
MGSQERWRNPVLTVLLILLSLQVERSVGL